MARIGIDGTHISLTGKGISRYQRNIIKSLSELDSGHDYYVFLNHASAIEPFVHHPRWHFIPVSIHKAIIWEQIQMPAQIKKLKLDLFHTTTDRLPYLGRTQFALQLFEVPHNRVSVKQKLKRPVYDRFADFSHLAFFRNSLRRANRILVSSRNTQNELIKKFKVASDKIRMIPIAHESTFEPLFDSNRISEIRRNLGAPEGYVLHFSTDDARENTETVLNVFAQIKGRINPEIKLVIVGNLKLDFDHIVHDLDLNDHVICKGYLDDAELIDVYRGALLYLDPSLYEGFGLQVLEAMACGVPVIASNQSALPELVGNSGILTDPHDRDQIAESAVQILAQKDLWEEMRVKGLKQAEQFSWAKAARETLSAFNEILNESH